MTLLQQANLHNQPSITSNQVSASHITTVSQPTCAQSLDHSFGNVLVLSCFPSISPHTWIFDSRATDHICSSLTYFVSYSQIKPIQVKLPNSHIVLAEYAGIVCFSKNFVLSNVLYIPNFNFNLQIVKLFPLLPNLHK